MSNSIFVVSFVTMLLSVFLEGHDAAIPRHLVDARLLQENVLPQDTSYRHRHRIVAWKGYDNMSKYICHTDCSGLINRLLEHSYKLSKETLHHWLGGRIRPLAKNYYKAIHGQDGFTRIDNVRQILPGDLVAMEYLPWAGDAGHDTGHILLVNAIPQQRGALSGSGLQQWSVEVIDCSHGHGKKDTRFRLGKYWPGIGKGFFALYSKPSGQLVGYSWTTASRSVFYGENKRPLAVGRLASFTLAEKLSLRWGGREASRPN